ncbi:hypothetical protein GEMRC1_005529 [Eukaryota sp. GEM-RC1]
MSLHPPAKLRKHGSVDDEVSALLAEHSRVTEPGLTNGPCSLTNHSQSSNTSVPSITASDLNNMIIEHLNYFENSLSTRMKALEKKVDTVLKRLPTQSTDSYPSLRSRETRSSPRLRSDKPVVEEEPVAEETTEVAEVAQQEPESPTDQLSLKSQDVTTLPRHLVFQAYLPPNWFYDNAISLNFLYCAVRNIPIVNRSTLTPKRCSDLTPSWQHCINQTLDHNPAIVLKTNGKYTLTDVGRDAFTSIGVNFGSPEGLKFVGSQRRLKKTEMPPRILDDDFEFQTFYDVLDLDENEPVEPESEMTPIEPVPSPSKPQKQPSPASRSTRVSRRPQRVSARTIPTRSSLVEEESPDTTATAAPPCSESRSERYSGCTSEEKIFGFCY